MLVSIQILYANQYGAALNNSDFQKVKGTILLLINLLKNLEYTVEATKTVDRFRR